MKISESKARELSHATTCIYIARFVLSEDCENPSTLERQIRQQYAHALGMLVAKEAYTFSKVAERAPREICGELLEAFHQTTVHGLAENYEDVILESAVGWAVNHVDDGELRE